MRRRLRSVERSRRAPKAAPALDGSLAVDPRTLDTGIGLRNEHLKGTYLEVDKDRTSIRRSCPAST